MRRRFCHASAGIGAARREHKPVGVILGDIDNFKSVTTPSASFWR